jgi:hypothetical protein
MIQYLTVILALSALLIAADITWASQTAPCEPGSRRIRASHHLTAKTSRASMGIGTGTVNQGIRSRIQRR